MVVGYTENLAHKCKIGGTLTHDWVFAQDSMALSCLGSSLNVGICTVVALAANYRPVPTIDHCNTETFYGNY